MKVIKLLPPIKLAWPRHFCFYWNNYTKPGEWVVVCICAMGIDFCLCFNDFAIIISISADYSYWVYISQLIRYYSASGSLKDFLDREFLVSQKLPNQRFLVAKLKTYVWKLMVAMMWCPLRITRKTDVPFVFTPICVWRGSCHITVFYIY